MARIHYSSRSDATRRGGRSYAGGATARAGKPKPELVPAFEGSVECPTCRGHVRLVGAIYDDGAAGIRTGKTKVLATHRDGGASSRGLAGRCPGSGTLPKETP